MSDCNNFNCEENLRRIRQLIKRGFFVDGSIARAGSVLSIDEEEDMGR